MNSQFKLVMFIFAALAAVNYVQAQNPPATNINPSQTSADQNPSQTVPPQNPSQTLPEQIGVTPGQSPNEGTPGQGVVEPGQNENPLRAAPISDNQGRGLTEPKFPNVPLTIEPVPPEPEAKLTDRQLSAKIRAAITQTHPAPHTNVGVAAGGTPVTDLKVTVSGGKVTLTGTARTEKEKADAGARAGAVAGTKNVVNNLFVR